MLLILVLVVLLLAVILIAEDLCDLADNKAAVIVGAVIVYVVLSGLLYMGDKKLDTIQDTRALERAIQDALTTTAYNMAASEDEYTIYVNDIVVTDVTLRYCLDNGYHVEYCDPAIGIVKFKSPSSADRR